jgi:peptide deformylase
MLSTAKHAPCCRVSARVTSPQSPASTWTDAAGAAQERVYEGFPSVVVQHELDHLDGVLFIDHISALKRNMILRKLLKARKEQERDAAEGRPPKAHAKEDPEHAL